MLAGMVCAFAGALLITGPARAGWQVAETEHFRVHSQGPDAGLIRQAALLEDFRGLLVTMTNAPPAAIDAPRLDIIIVDRMSLAQPYAKTASDIAGFYSAGPGRIVAFVDASESGQAVLLHEYAHHFMLASGGVAYPAWYVEGFAEYFMTARFRPERIEFGLADENRVSWLLYAPWQKLESLISATPKLKYGSDRAVYYAEAWLLTHYLFRTPGMAEKFGAYLQAVATGTESVAAFQRHIDPDIASLQTRLKRYLTSRNASYTRFTRPASTPASVRLSKLPASANRLLLPLIAIERGLDSDEAVRAIADVRTKAADLPGDPLAQRTLALAELRHGAPDAGMAILDRLLAATPDDATLLRWKAQALGPAPADRREARRLLVRSFKIDPNDWRTLFAYAQLSDPLDKPLDKSTLDVLLRANELAPQVKEIAIAAAIALAVDDLLPAAARLLEPVAYAPHGGATAAWAAAMLERARAGDKPGFIAARRRGGNEDSAAAE